MVTTICASRRILRWRSPAGVSPVRTHVLISTSRQSAPAQFLADTGQRHLQIALECPFEEGLQRRDIDDPRLVPSSPGEALPYEVIDRCHEGGKVLPEPVGAAISVCRPALISGHASACAAVARAKRPSNQSATAG